MHVGIDLAWNSRARTGLAMVDASGALVASTSVRTDDEIDAWLAGVGAGVLNVAIDAPLIVTNVTGMRECERLIGQAYGRYDASCHASNLSKPYLNPPRAATLAARHGWVVDPAHVSTAAAPGAIEVYPHPAMVGIFGLGRILKYKSGPLAVRQAAFVELLNRMETIRQLGLDQSARWQQIRRTVADGPRQVDLDVVEDEVDAILCAHLAWLWHNDPPALQVYGDAVSGYIVAPPPPTHPTTPRPPHAPSGVAAALTTAPDGERDPEAVPDRSRVVDVVGRPTGYAGEANELAWKTAVRRAFEEFAIPAPTRVSIELEFRLGPNQRAHNAPDLDNLIKSTIDALEGVLGLRPVRGRAQADDERIDRIVATKRPARADEDPGAMIRISAITPS